MRMKILFISPRAFGLMGTPGSYLLVESYAKYADMCVIANKNKNKNVEIVYKADKLNNFHELDFNAKNFLDELSSVVENFSPQIIIMANYARWFYIVTHLKERYKKVKYVLDIKSPLITGGDESAQSNIQDKGSESQDKLDLIMTRCKEDVDTWIPNCTVPVFKYPLGIKNDEYSPKYISDRKFFCKKFVYVGSISPLRKLDEMIHYINNLPNYLKNNVTFDFYGSGPALSDLKRLVQKFKLDRTVFFKGVLDSSSLSKVLPEYDAGIAWVPHGLYEYAPSLKLLEYFASGIVPIAMNTIAHERYSDQGFHIEFFSNSLESFKRTLNNVFEQGIVTSNRDKNIKLIAKHDWDIIVNEKMLPALTNLLDNHEKIQLTESLGTVSSMEDFCHDGCLNETLRASPEIYDRVRLWSPSWNNSRTEKISQSKIRIAGLLGDRLYKALNLECDLMLLTPETWNSVLSYTKPDFLLMESIWSSTTGHWYMDQSISGEGNYELLKILSHAKRKGIPTVFWMTLDCLYHKNFINFAKEFDFVFCADHRSIDLFHKDGVDAKVLLPAIQPVLFNPIQDPLMGRTFNSGTLYDGWVDLHHFPDIGDTLKKISKSRLNIFQTKLMMYEGQLKHIDTELIPYVRGTVSDDLLPDILKHSGMYLSFEKSTKSRTEKSWSILEAAACRLPIAHLGELDRDNPINEIVQRFEKESAFCEYVLSQNGFNLSLEKDKQKNWRTTYLNHIFSKRIQTICQEIGIDNDWVEYPKASLVTGTMRPSLLSKCFKQYEDQNYPNKELVLIFNGSSEEIEDYQKQYAENDDISINAIPSECTVGKVLNYGLYKSTGDYFFRIDDDDIYAPNYILDSILYLRAFNAEIFGKRASFFHFEGDSEIYLRNALLPSIKKFPGKFLHESDDYLVSGCSFSAQTQLLKELNFHDFIQGSVDTALIDKIKAQKPNLKCLLTDNLNLIVERASDLSTHTWRADAEAIKKKGYAICESFRDLVC